MFPFDVEPLKPFGAALLLDLGREFDQDTKDALRQAFREHRVLVFRGQAVPRERQKALTRLFGKLPPDGFGLSYVSNKGGAATLGDSEITYHFDMDFAPDPYRVISLYAEAVDDGQTSTSFVNAVQLWRDMPSQLRSRLTGRQVRNVYSLDYSCRPVGDEMDPRLPEHVYSLPRPHPITGEPILSVSFSGTREVVGMTADESETLLQEVFEFCARPEHVFEHFWNTDDLLVWDNLALLHARGATGKAERVLRKVSAVERTLEEQFPQFPGGWKDIATLFNKLSV